MQELQEEEIEVLASIYDGDGCYTAVSPTRHQYKIENADAAHRSFLLEVSWPENYPDEFPIISLEAFYNNHLISEVKDLIISELKKEAENLLGCAMTYSLFDYAKEHAEELTQSQPAQAIKVSEREDKTQETAAATSSTTTIKEPKQQLSKAQKRKMFNRLDNKGELPRGWNWVDVVKHLSQTGSSKTSSQT